DLGEGNLTQSIFMRNELVDTGQAGEEMYYQNVVIEGNEIYNGHLHGITVGETAGLTVSNNSVLHADGNRPDGADDEVEIPTININSASTDVTITNNAVADINGYAEQPDWTVKDNAYVQDQDPDAPGWYEDVFTAESLSSETGGHAYVPAEGGMLDMLDAGAVPTLPSEDSTDTDPEIPVDGGQDDSPPPIVQINYSYDLDFDGTDTYIRMWNGAELIETGDTPAVHLDDNSFVGLGRLPDYEESDQIAFSIDFAHDETTMGNERLVWNHMKIGLSIHNGGLMVHTATADEGFKVFKTGDLGLDDTEQHQAVVMLDAEQDRLQVLLDGDVVLDVEDGTDFEIVNAGGREWGWTLGNQWNRSFEGEISDFSIADEFTFVDTPTYDDGLGLI
ncbi:right-handed parallel beta-helix repeat-containing protein, partial [Actibacterium sp. D379-3]